MHQAAYRMGYFVDGRAGNPGGGNEDGRGGKKVREYKPVIRRGGPSGVTIEDAGCIERIPPEYDRCRAALAADSGAFCDTHKVEVRKNT